MKAKIRLSYAIELTVEGRDEDEIMEWLNESTPSGVAAEMAIHCKYPYEEYEEEIIEFVDDDQEADYVIR